MFVERNAPLPLPAPCPRSDAAIDRLYTDDTITASQWTALHDSHQRSGEQRLYRAVIDLAIQDYVNGQRRPGYEPSRRALKRHYDAERWIFTPNDGSPGTFDYVCDVLGIESTAFRQKLSRRPPGSMFAEGPGPKQLSSREHLRTTGRITPTRSRKRRRALA